MKPHLDVHVFPELSPDAAPPHIRAIYDEICRWAAVPMAALIFRNLATHPGVLEEVWDGIGPLFRSGQIQDAAWRIARTAVPKDLLPPIEAHARAVMGLSDETLVEVRNTLDAYNRANPVNLLAMLCLLERLKTDAPAQTVPLGAWTPPAPIPSAIPKMALLDTMSPQIRWLINDLGFGDRSKLAPVVPSLYRHLTNWPGYLAVLHVTLLPRFRDGTIAAATEQLRQAMAREAVPLALSLPPLRRLATIPEVPVTITNFTATVIPQMIVIGTAMRQSLV